MSFGTEAAGRVGVLLGVALLVAGGAWAQAPPDTTQVPPDTVAPTPVPVAPLDSVAAADGASAERTFVSADSLSALVRDGERVQDLFDNVFVRQDTTRLRSAYARRYLEQERFLFTEDVVIYERGDTLRADTVWYDKRTKVGRARGNVQLTDGEVVVRAPRAIYYTDEKRSVFPDSVTLVDSTRVLRAEQGTYWSDAKRAEFKGNVRLTDPETDLEADSLAYYRDTERSVATGEVFIRRSDVDTTTTADTTVTDTTARTYLFGRRADNQEQRQYSRVEGRALLVRVRFDSTGTPRDTFIVRAHRLDAYRLPESRRLVALDSVRIWQADLSAVADSAVYDQILAPGPRAPLPTPAPRPGRARPDTGSATDAPRPVLARSDTLVGLAGRVPPLDSARTGGARGSRPSPSPGSTAVPPDTAAPSTRPDTTRADTTRADTLQSDTTATPPSRARANRGPPQRPPGDAAGQVPPPQSNWGRPTADSSTTLPLEETRLFGTPDTWFGQGQVWGDSIRVRSRARNIDTVFVRGRAFAAQQDTSLDRIHQLKGRTLLAAFRADSLRRVVAEPNAQAIRFLAGPDGGLSGAAKASGDRIVLYVRDGTVKRVAVHGGIQSNYYRKPNLIPDPFRLEGFQWTPERRPTRRGLLQDERVRRRLGLTGPRPALARRPDSTEEQRRPRRRAPAGSARPPARSVPDSRPDPHTQPARLDSSQAVPAPDTTTSPPT